MAGPLETSGWAAPGCWDFATLLGREIRFVVFTGLSAISLFSANFRNVPPAFSGLWYSFSRSAEFSFSFDGLSRNLSSSPGFTGLFTGVFGSMMMTGFGFSTSAGWSSCLITGDRFSSAVAGVDYSPSTVSGFSTTSLCGLLTSRFSTTSSSLSSFSTGFSSSDSSFSLLTYCFW